MDEFLALGRQYGWFLIIALYLVLNIDKAAKPIGMFVPRLDQWLKNRQERWQSEQALESDVIERLFGLFEKQSQLLIDIRDRLEEIKTELVRNNHGLQRNNDLMTAFNARQTQIEEQRYSLLAYLMEQAGIKAEETVKE